MIKEKDLIKAIEQAPTPAKAVAAVQKLVGAVVWYLEFWARDKNGLWRHLGTDKNEQDRLVIYVDGSITTDWPQNLTDIGGITVRVEE